MNEVMLGFGGWGSCGGGGGWRDEADGLFLFCLVVWMEPGFG